MSTLFPELAEDTGSKGAVRRPLIGLAVFFMAGVGAGLYFEVPWSWLLAPAFLMSLALLRVRSTLAGALCTGAAVFLAGWLHASLAIRSPSARALPARMDRDREHVELIGRVRTDAIRSPARRVGWVVHRFPLAVEAIRRRSCAERADGVVQVIWRTKADSPSPRYGERWQWQGLLERRPRFENGRGGWTCTLRPEADGARRLSAGGGWGLVAWCLDKRRACFDLLGRGLEREPDIVALLRTLMLGYRQEMSPRLLRAFALTGTLHIIAISGLHVGIMVVLFIAGLKALGRSRSHWGVYLAPALLGYAIGTGLSASTLRATLMALIIWLAPLFRRRPDGPSSLALAALLILLFAPLQLTDLGFLFSFSAVSALMIWHPLWIRPVAARLQPDPWAAPGAERGAPLRGLLLYLASMFLAATAVWITTAPLTARFFNLVAPLSLPGNLLVIPLAFVVLLTGTLALLFGSLSAWLAEVFNHANRVFIGLLLGGIEWFSKFRWGYSYVPTPPAWLMAAWWAWLALLRMARRRTAIALIGVAALAAGLGLQGRRQVVHADVLDVGQGQAVYVNLPGSHDVLVDTGPAFGARRVIRYLRRHGVNGLCALILTHGDAEHIGGADEILKEMPVAEVWSTPHLGRSALYRALREEVRRRGIPWRTLSKTDSGVFPGGVEWEVLYPPAERSYRRADDASLVLRVARGATAMMIMGGAGGPVEQELLGGPLDLAASVLLPGDHGAEGTCTTGWLAQVRPAAAVISVGLGNIRGQPDPSALKRLRAVGIPTWRTDRDGTIRIKFQPTTPGVRGRECRPVLTPSSPAPEEGLESPDRPESD